MAARTTRTSRVPGAPTHDRRFRRSRSRAERTPRELWLTRAWRAARLGAVLGLAGWGAALIYTVVTGGAWFAVEDIRVRGNDRLSTGEVSVLLDGLRGRNVVVSPLDPWRERLLGSPWVKEASLRRVLPDAVDVTIVERLPVAIARSGVTLSLIDAEGAFIDEYGPRYASLDLPLLQGLEGKAEDDTAARTALALDALADLSDAGMLWRVSQIDVSRPHDAVVTMNDDTTLLHLGDTSFAERLQAYLDMSQRLHAMAADLEYVDLRFNDRVYIRPRRAGVTFASMPTEVPAEASDAIEVDVIPDDAAGQE